MAAQRGDEKLFEQMDCNGDGDVSEQEWIEFLRETYRHTHTNPRRRHTPNASEPHGRREKGQAAGPIWLEELLKTLHTNMDNVDGWVDPVHKLAKKIVESLDGDNDGFVSEDEVKVMVASLLRIRPEQVPENHKDVKAFQGMKKDELINKLCTTVAQKQLEIYFDAMHAEHTFTEEGTSLSRIRPSYLTQCPESRHRVSSWSSSQAPSGSKSHRTSLT